MDSHGKVKRSLEESSANKRAKREEEPPEAEEKPISNWKICRNKWVELAKKPEACDLLIVDISSLGEDEEVEEVGAEDYLKTIVDSLVTILSVNKTIRYLDCHGTELKDSHARKLVSAIVQIAEERTSSQVQAINFNNTSLSITACHDIALLCQQKNISVDLANNNYVDPPTSVWSPVIIPPAQDFSSMSFCTDLTAREYKLPKEIELLNSLNQLLAAGNSLTVAKLEEEAKKIYPEHPNPAVTCLAFNLIGLLQFTSESEFTKIYNDLISPTAQNLFLQRFVSSHFSDFTSDILTWKLPQLQTEIIQAREAVTATFQVTAKTATAVDAHLLAMDIIKETTLAFFSGVYTEVREHGKETNDGLSLKK